MNEKRVACTLRIRGHLYLKITLNSQFCKVLNLYKIQQNNGLVKSNCPRNDNCIRLNLKVIEGSILPSRIDTLIADCASWAEFRELAGRQKIPKDKGDLFERLTQIYLQTHPTYRSKIKNVWWCNNGELPEQIRRELNLPETDEGIDLLCETY